MTEYVTKFGSLADYDKGGIDLINDQAKNYAFSNIFEVANSSKPWEKVAVGKNMQYVLEAIRAEGTSEWRTCAHDEFPLCMDGEVTIELVKLDTPAVAADKEGSVRVEGEPAGTKMGRIVLRRGASQPWPTLIQSRRVHWRFTRFFTPALWRSLNR